MLTLRFLLATGLFLYLTQTATATPPPLVSSLSPEQIREYHHQPQAVRKLIRDALDLTRKNLTYLYGSNSPSHGGMDCSGTVQYILKNQSISSVPRQANQIHRWLKQQGKLNSVSDRTLASKEFEKLKPGDLLFWSGTYRIDRDITHVMIYLGTDKTTGKPIMVGASDGRRYNGMKRRGVSVFDFKLPRTGSKARFVGYGPVPGLIAAQPEVQQKAENASNEIPSLVF